jgi:BirA family transcriptional regulator, biotin operon repressor / biotin---[acetyl-CoA-carboxylase] ligase
MLFWKPSPRKMLTKSDTYLPVVTSTSDLAKRLAEEGAGDGTVVVADYQTAGRGRLGRRWEAPPRSSLLMSVVLRPDLEPHEAQQMTMLCGLAVVDAIEQGIGLKVGLKWPNDIVLEGAKLGGILAEACYTEESLAYVIVGLGLNVNLDPNHLIGKPAMPVTSLSQALGRRVPRSALLKCVLDAIDTRYSAQRAGWSPRDEWAACLTTVGRLVTVTGLEGTIDGTAAGVDGDGALLVRLESGRVERVLAGDVTLRTDANWHEAHASGTMAGEVS